MGGGGLAGAFEIPNYRRAPFWKFFWAQHFVTRQHIFNVHHTGYIVLCVFFWWTGAFATAPIERREKYYMHSPKFRLQTAYANPAHVQLQRSRRNKQRYAISSGATII